MVWNNVEKLPWFWEPFYSLTFALMAGIAVPVALAALLGWFMFKGRVTGVYVAIINHQRAGPISYSTRAREVAPTTCGPSPGR